MCVCVCVCVCVYALCLQAACGAALANRTQEVEDWIAWLAWNESYHRKQAWRPACCGWAVPWENATLGRTLHGNATTFFFCLICHLLAL
eukprot:COSAG05_NODE_3082_length_2338_cov_1.901295_3_plen_89_part_00